MFIQGKKKKGKFLHVLYVSFKCVDVKSGRVRMVYHIPVTFPGIMVSGKL